MGNPASTLLPTHHPLSLCQKSKKSLERLLRSQCDEPTDQPTNILTLCSTEVENCNVLSDLAPLQSSSKQPLEVIRITKINVHIL